MRLSAKIALWGWALWVLFYLIASATAPSPDDFFEDPSSLGGLRFFGGLSSLSFVVALASSVIYAFRAFMDRPSTTHTYYGRVSHTTVNTGNNAVVATNHSTIAMGDQSINSSVHIQNTGQLLLALDELEKFAQQS